MPAAPWCVSEPQFLEKGSASTVADCVQRPGRHPRLVNLHLHVLLCHVLFRLTLAVTRQRPGLWTTVRGLQAQTPNARRVVFFTSSITA